MRVSTKLAVGLIIASASVLGSYGYVELRQEEHDLREAVKHDVNLLGMAVKVAVENSVRDGQTDDVRKILDSLELGDPAIDVLVFDAQGNLTAGSLGSEPSVEKVQPSLLRAPPSSTELRFDRIQTLTGIFPLWDDEGKNLGWIAIVHPLDELRRDLTATKHATVLSSVTLIVAINAVAWVLVFLYVRRPLTQLVGAMRAVRAGNLTACIPPTRADELGAMASEFNLMLGKLEEARQRLIDAAEAREVLESGLQRLDKLATLGQVSAGLAHEIGSPLQILSGRARQLASRGDLPAEVQRSARILEEQSDRIAKIVEQLLNFARRKSAQMGQVDLGPVVATIVELFEPEARRCGVQLDFDRTYDLPRVVADPDQVQQVAMNLLTNALRATPRGGRIRLAVAPSSFASPDGSRREDSVSLVIDDTGEGMSDEVSRRMFEPFFTTGAEAGWTGLGLAIVKSIVDEHGGAISASSDAGSGTRVTVHFPVAGARSTRAMVA